MRSVLLIAMLVASVVVADEVATIEPEALAARLQRHDAAPVIRRGLRPFPCEAGEGQDGGAAFSE